MGPPATDLLLSNGGDHIFTFPGLPDPRASPVGECHWTTTSPTGLKAAVGQRKALTGRRYGSWLRAETLRACSQEKVILTRLDGVPRWHLPTVASAFIYCALVKGAGFPSYRVP